jgi:hypothetical protein
MDLYFADYAAASAAAAEAAPLVTSTPTVLVGKGRHPSHRGGARFATDLAAVQAAITRAGG